MFPRRTLVRRALVIVVAALTVFVSGLLSGVLPARAEHHPPSRTLRVMTFNIHHGEGTDGRLDLPRVADVIRTEGVSVVGLQEVDRHWSERSDFVDQASWLARELRMHVVYGANLDVPPDEPGGPRRQYGTAILSRWPILDRENTYLPRFEDHEQRGLLRAEIAARGARVQVYTTHLQHNDAAERLAQTRAIRRIIGTPDRPVVLLGDLNATPDSAEIRTLTGRFVDAWAVAGAGDGFTYPNDGPDRRIDYVMVSRDVLVRDARVVDHTPEASDHLPVVADVRLRQGG